MLNIVDIIKIESDTSKMKLQMVLQGKYWFPWKLEGEGVQKLRGVNGICLVCMAFFLFSKAPNLHNKHECFQT